MNTGDRISDEIRWRELLEIDPPPFIQVGHEAYEDLLKDRRTSKAPGGMSGIYIVFGIPFCEHKDSAPWNLRYMDEAGHYGIDLNQALGHRPSN